MTQVERDPRVDPRPGDVLTNGRTVVRIDLVPPTFDGVGFVRWIEGDDEDGHAGRLSLPRFRVAAAGAEVIALGIPGRGSVWGESCS